jgi:hypothetical protein
MKHNTLFHRTLGYLINRSKSKYDESYPVFKNSFQMLFSAEGFSLRPVISAEKRNNKH